MQALGVGEALVSVLDEKGVPSIVEKAGILPPKSSMKAADAADIQAVINASPLKDKYTQTEDRRSAYEELEEDRAEAAKEAEEQAKKAAKEKERTAKRSTSSRSTSSRSSSSRKTQSALNKTINSAANTIGRELGKQFIRGLFGTLKR